MELRLFPMTGSHTVVPGRWPAAEPINIVTLEWLWHTSLAQHLLCLTTDRHVLQCGLKGSHGMAFHTAGTLSALPAAGNDAPQILASQ